MLPAAMLEQHQQIHPDALPLFKGKQIRIFGHDDGRGVQRLSVGRDNSVRLAPTWTPTISRDLFEMTANL